MGVSHQHLVHSSTFFDRIYHVDYNLSCIPELYKFLHMELLLSYHVLDLLHALDMLLIHIMQQLGLVLHFICLMVYKIYQVSH